MNMPEFIQKWVEDKARDRVIQEVGVIESEWPAHTGSAIASGFRTPTSESCSILLSIPSSKWFKPRMLWVDNENTIINRIYLYVGSQGASASIGGLWIGPRETQFIALDGITCGGDDVYVSCLVASVHVRIAGILVESGPEN